MKIVYVAKHESGDNDDEGAICYALKSLGHEVARFQEYEGDRAVAEDGDFMLVHKWSDIDSMRRAKIPLVFWYFDLVFSEDPGLVARTSARGDWMRAVEPLCVVGFCTDGDWIIRHKSEKLVHLFQGADERTAGLGEVIPDVPKIIFTGERKHSYQRIDHLSQLTERYGDDFRIIGSGRGHRIHGKDLSNALATASVCVCPDAPITELYWSNRVYLLTGLGGCVLHPYKNNLAKQYDPKTEVPMYNTREELHELIEHFIANPEERQAVREAALARTMKEHLYRHRVMQLIETVKERI